MKRAFVTGGTGFIGLNLIHELVDQGWEVTALYRRGSDMRYLNALPTVQKVKGDVTEIDTLRAGMPEGVDAVFHVASNVNLWSRENVRQTRDNVDGPRNMGTVALEKKARRFIHTSSIVAYGFHEGPITEETPENATSSWINYPRSKALGEKGLRTLIDGGLDAVILNPASVVGPYDVRNWATAFHLASRGRLLGAPPGRGSFCHVHELVLTHIRAVEHGRTGENYLIGGTDATYLEATRIVCELTGSRVPKRASPAWVMALASRVMTWSYPLHGKRSLLTPEAAKITSVDLLCRDDKAQRELGHRPVPLRKMFGDCYRWMESEGRLGNNVRAKGLAGARPES